jgi:hypothetical protein
VRPDGLSLSPVCHPIEAHQLKCSCRDLVQPTPHGSNSGRGSASRDRRRAGHGRNPQLAPWDYVDLKFGQQSMEDAGAVVAGLPWVQLNNGWHVSENSAGRASGIPNKSRVL